MARRGDYDQHGYEVDLRHHRSRQYRTNDGNRRSSRHYRDERDRGQRSRHHQPSSHNYRDERDRGQRRSHHDKPRREDYRPECYERRRRSRGHRSRHHNGHRSHGRRSPRRDETRREHVGYRTAPAEPVRKKAIVWPSGDQGDAIDVVPWSRRNMNLIRTYFTQAPNALPVLSVVSRTWRRHPSVDSEMILHCLGHSHRDYRCRLGQHGLHPIVEIVVQYPKAFTKERSMWEIVSKRLSDRQYRTADLDNLGLSAAAYSPCPDLSSSSAGPTKYLAYGLRPWKGQVPVTHQFLYYLNEVLKKISDNQTTSKGGNVPLQPAPASWRSNITQATSASIRSISSAGPNDGTPKLRTNARDDIEELRKNEVQYRNYLERLDPQLSERERNRITRWAASTHVRLFKVGHGLPSTGEPSVSSMTEG